MRGNSTSALIIAAIVLAGCGSQEKSAAPVAPARDAASPAPAAAVAAPATLAGRDVVIAVVDGLRADAVNAEDTPFIQGLGSQTLSFSDAISNSSHVLQSLASFLTGRLPTRGGAIGVYEAEPHDEAKTIAQYFKDAGYYTGMIANHPALQGKGFTKGYEEIQVAGAGQPLDDMSLAKRAGEFFEDAGNSKAFLYVHFAGPLASKLYRPADTAAAAGPFSVREFGQAFAAQLNGKPTGAEDFRDRIDATRTEYAAAAKSADAAVKALVESLRAQGRADKTLLIVTSLHGFELFEHGYLGPGWTLYDESVHVPLIFFAPGAIAAQKLAAPVSLVDVLPSVLTLLGVGFDGTRLDGQPLIRAETDGLQVIDGDRPRIAELVIPERCIVRTASQAGWTYMAASLWAEPKDRHAIAEAHRDTANAYLDGSRQAPPLWGATAMEAVFKGPADEALPLKDNEQARAPLAMVLEEYRERCEKSGIAPRMAMKSVKAIDEEKVQNLQSLGYL